MTTVFLDLKKIKRGLLEEAFIRYQRARVVNER